MTIIYKFVIPVFWLGVFGDGTISMFSHGHKEALIFLVGLIVGAFFLAITCFPLKRVRVNGDDLLISNYIKTVKVPVSAIEDVTESLFINIHPVWIHFRHKTEFGKKIMFMPVQKFILFGSHPIVCELKELAKLS